MATPGYANQRLISYPKIVDPEMSAFSLSSQAANAQIFTQFLCLLQELLVFRHVRFLG